MIGNPDPNLPTGGVLKRTLNKRERHLMNEPRIVKRYSNRKLYDTQTSSYVTLEQIAEMVRAKEDVKIIDNNTKEDLTSVTLAQIVFEEEKKKRLIPLNTLKNIIQSKGETISGFVTQLGRDLDKQMGRVFRRHPHKEGDKEGDEDPSLQEHHTSEEAQAVSVTEGSNNIDLGDKNKNSKEQKYVDYTSLESGGAQSSHPSLDFLRDWLISSQKSFDEWQVKLDEQIRSAIESMSPLAPLQKQVETLTDRIAELEARLNELEGKE